MGIFPHTIMTTETTAEIVEKFVSDNVGYYLDTYESYTEVGIEDKQLFGAFLASLEDRSIKYHIVQSGLDGWYIVEVYR
jgi:hypothetical protein